MGRPVRLDPTPISPGGCSLLRGQGENGMYHRNNQQNCLLVDAEFYIGLPNSAGFCFLKSPYFYSKEKGTCTSYGVAKKF